MKRFLQSTIAENRSVRFPELLLLVAIVLLLQGCSFRKALVNLTYGECHQLDPNTRMHPEKVIELQRQAKHLPPNFEGRFANVDGHPVYYVESMDESPDQLPVVLVHGLGLSHRYLMPTAVLLAPDFKVFVPNLPGFGKSYKPDEILDVEGLADGLDRWMEAIDLPSAAFLGNSMGCQVIIALATRHPARVRRAVLQGPTYDPAGGGFLGQAIRWQCNVIRESYDSERSIAGIAYDEAGRWRILRTYCLALKDRPEQVLPYMECPTLIVRGSKDPIVSQDWAETMVRLLPNGRLVVLPGLSHTLNWVAPFDLVSVAAPFLMKAAPTDRAERREMGQFELIGDTRQKNKRQDEHPPASSHQEM